MGFFIVMLFRTFLLCSFPIHANRLQHDRTFQTLLFDLTGQLVCLVHIAAELVVIRVTAAAAIESCPAVPAVRLAVDMSLGEVGLHFTVKCAVVHVAHFIVCLTDKLMTRI